MQGNGTLSNANDFERSPSQNSTHGEKEENSQGDSAARVSLDKLPKAKNCNLRETNKDL